MIYFVYPQLRKLSGAERLILALATHTNRRGVPVTLVTHYFDASCRPALNGVRVLETGRQLAPTRNHYLNAPFEYLYALRLLDWVGTDARAVVFFGPPSLPALAWSAFRRKPLVPCLYFCYEPPRFIYDDTRAIVERMGTVGCMARPLFALYKQLDRAMVRRADALLANSHFGAARLQAAYGRSAAVITHGADFVPPSAEQVEAVRARYNLQGRCVTLTVNFLHPRKRIDLFLRAVARAQAHAPQLRALVVGAGPEAARLQALSRELGLEAQVTFTGFVPDEQLPAYYAASQLYVHTGKLESFGLSVLEASMAGLPVVTVDEGGPREIVADGETGKLVAAEPDALASAMLELLNDPARRAQLGAAGRRRSQERYSWERGADELIQVLNQVGAV